MKCEDGLRVKIGDKLAVADKRSPRNGYQFKVASIKRLGNNSFFTDPTGSEYNYRKVTTA